MFPGIKLFAGLSLLALAIFPLACHKRVLVIPDACVTADKTDVKQTDTVVFTDCCQAAEQTQLLLYKSSGPVPNPDQYVSFDAQHHYKKLFTDTGNYTALIRAINMEVPIQESKLLISVRK